MRRETYEAMTYAQRRRHDRKQQRRERERLGMTPAQYKAHKSRETSELLKRLTDDARAFAMSRRQQAEG